MMGIKTSTSPVIFREKFVKASAVEPNFILTRWLFFRGLGLIHLVAFGSYAVQIIGLNGSQGIESTHDLLKSMGEQLGPMAYYLMPTLEWLNSSDVALQALAWVGTVLSLFVMFGVLTGPVLVVLDLLWLSLSTGGGQFTEFQSDGMLVEATTLSLFFVSWQLLEPPLSFSKHHCEQRAPSKLSLFLLRFMIFRLMLASGIVKILSGDETWSHLTALNFHFETQPIPTPLAWYVHWLPEWTHKGSVLAMYLSELLAPFLIFAGRKPRLIAAILIAGLHFMIALTGNYTFLNMLCMLLCLPLLDDAMVSHLVPKWLVRRIVVSSEKSASSDQSTKSQSRWTTLVSQAVAAMLIALASTQLCASTLGSIVPTFLLEALRFVAPFHIADGYGLFAVMTTTRPEIVFEGSKDGKNWESYEFKYKPGDDLKRAPPWVEPHMPRLDWRLWFAAMEPLEKNPWVLGLVLQLLQGSPAMRQFFAYDPFPHEPPVLIRAFVYDYHFTTPGEKASTGAWWRRDNKRVYLPPVGLVDGKLVMVR
jgi:lipase maturation factor 1